MPEMIILRANIGPSAPKVMPFTESVLLYRAVILKMAQCLYPQLFGEIILQMAYLLLSRIGESILTF